MEDENITPQEAMSLWESLSPQLRISLIVVGSLIVIVTIIAFIISAWLSVKYVKFNRRNASCGLSGGEVARRVLDSEGLQDIKVTKSGSLLFGNSYSHFFKKVRLRRRTIDKTSLTSVGMGAEKASLAILDKNGDKDMKRRIFKVPFIAVGPFLFIPLIIIGAIIDYCIQGASMDATILFCSIGIVLYAIAFFFQFQTLKTERKAQNLACQKLTEQGLATDEEIAQLRELYRLYNIEYINNMVLSMLEILYRVLEIFAKAELEKK